MSGVTDCRDAALRYVANKIYVIPLGKDKRPDGSKCPHGVLDSTTDPAQVKEWWPEGSMQGIGIHCGRTGWIVVDIDHPETMTQYRNNPPNLQSEWLMKMLDKHPTARQMTRANWRELSRDENDIGPLAQFRQHVVYGMPAGEPLGNTTGTLGSEWGDIRGENGYIAAYPTPHSKGGEYRWDSGIVVPLPEEIEKKLRERATRNGNGNAVTDNESIGEGGRNTTLTGLAGYMRNLGLSLDAIRAELLSVNAKRCQPPLDESEVEGIVTSISRYPSGEALSGVGALWAQQFRDDAANTGALTDAESGDDAQKFKEELEHEKNVVENVKKMRVSRDAQRRLDAEERASVQSISIISDDDVLAMPDLKWLVTTDDGRGILASEGIFELSAQRQQFKTAIILDLLLSINNKLDRWLDWSLDPSTNGELPHTVLAIGEGGAGMRRRIEAWLTAHPGSSLSRFHLVPFNGFCLTSPEDVTTIISAIKQKVGNAPVAVTVFDAFPDIFTGDENGAGDVGRAVTGMRRVAHELGGGLCGVTQHSGYNTSRGRGSSRLPDAMDTVLHIENHVIRATKVKEDDFNAVGPIPMMAEPVRNSFVVRRAEGLADACVRSASGPEAKAREKIIQALEIHGKMHAGNIKDVCGGSKAANERRLDELVAEGLLTSVVVGRATMYELKGTVA